MTFPNTVKTDSMMLLADDAMETTRYFRKLDDKELLNLGLHIYEYEGPFATQEGVKVSIKFVTPVGLTDADTINQEFVTAFERFTKAEPNTVGQVLKAQMKSPDIQPTIFVLNAPIDETGQDELEVKGDGLLGGNYTRFSNIQAQLVSSNGGVMPDLLLLPSPYRNHQDGMIFGRKMARLSRELLLPAIIYNNPPTIAEQNSGSFSYVVAAGVLDQLGILEYKLDMKNESLVRQANERWNIDVSN